MGASWSSNTVVPPGFGFHPSNEVLIKDYLRPKIMGNDPQVDNYIPTIDDLCKSNPSELPSLCWRPWNRERCYFFCKWNQYGKGTRCDRKTKTGYWKKTGKELGIFDQDTGKRIGKRSILVFYEGRNPGRKTDYIIHVYEMTHDISHQSASYVICRLQIDADKTKKTKNKVETPSNIDGEPSGTITPDLEIPGDPASVIPQDSNGLGESNPGWFSQLQDSSLTYGGEPSVNATFDSDIPLAPTVTQVVCGQMRAGFESFDSQPVYSPEGHHYEQMQASYENVEPELSLPELIMNTFYVHETLDDIFYDPGQPISLETSSFPDVPFSRITEAGVDGNVESGSLALESHSSREANEPLSENIG